VTTFTQSFNTTTSMGRLTLNVLLSFAQFVRGRDVMENLGETPSSRGPAVVYGLTNCNAADDCRNSASEGEKDERTHSRKGDAAY
jgi:hypothetical protein